MEEEQRRRIFPATLIFLQAVDVSKRGEHVLFHKVICNCERILGCGIFCELQSLMKLDPGKGLALLWVNLHLDLVVHQLCHPEVHDLGVVFHRVANSMIKSFNLLELALLKTSLLLCFPPGCLVVRLSFVSVTLGKGPVVVAIGSLDQEELRNL